LKEKTMRSRKLAVLGTATLIAISPLGMSAAFAANVGASTSMAVSGPNGSGSPEAETQGSAKGSAHVHAPRVGAPGPTGSGSAEAETQGSGPKTKIHPGHVHHSGGAVTNQAGATGSAGTTR
jgi:hypothetical protein